MSEEHGGRGDGLAIPKWWLERVREMRDDRGDALVWLGEQLALAVGRDEPWSHGTLSRFLRGQNTTRELAEAFVKFYGIPPFLFEARSLDEALSLQAQSKKYDSPSNRATPERDRRLANADQVLDEEVALADSQKAEVRSGDGEERGSPRRRAGRAARGRTSAS